MTLNSRNSEVYAAGGSPVVLETFLSLGGDNWPYAATASSRPLIGPEGIVQPLKASFKVGFV